MSELPESVETAEDFITDVMEPQEVGGGHPRWHKHVALTTLIMALLTALGAILAGMSSHQAMIERTQEIIEVNSLEGDRVYVETLKSKHEILTALGETPDQAEITTIAAFEKEIQELETQAAGEETLVLTATRSHHTFTIAVALITLHGLNAKTVCVVGNGTVQHTADGGETWQEQAPSKSQEPGSLAERRS